MLEFTGNPIEPQRDTWDWGEIRAIPLDLSDEKAGFGELFYLKMVVSLNTSSSNYRVRRLIFCARNDSTKIERCADMAFLT